ncbi:P22 phage major capsid protein family protein [Micromonospora sp. WMMD1082]|uniref:P22 phage major capsid protein family protein n=1 Tax=Micromonospora sp. WMMD1082 TaxID=3016104 RepID=UPI002417C819|nr:P22 phage major capsid protein family protein [Micromonospora sp. WMMD1082]MDG4792695.1 P22 phage major capsid protein family protein [Micromonospora sp. WMMD1082]
MPHDFVIPEQVLRTAIALVRDDLGTAGTFNRDYEDNFGGGKGTVVNVRVPATLKARRRLLSADGTPITVDTIEEDTVPVAMTHHVYSAVDVSDVQMRMDIESFARQVVVPQVRGIVEDIENFAVETLQALPESVGLPYDPEKPHLLFTRARKILRDLGLSADGLWAACGTGVYADLVDANAFTSVSESGSAEALRNANVGRVRSFNTVENNRLADDEVVFYGRDSFTLAIRAPFPPDGAAFSASDSANGFAMTWVKDYDSQVLKDRSVFQTYIGTKAMQVKRLDKSGTTSLVTPALRVLTGTEPDED